MIGYCEKLVLEKEVVECQSISFIEGQFLGKTDLEILKEDFEFTKVEIDNLDNFQIFGLEDFFEIKGFM